MKDVPGILLNLFLPQSPCHLSAGSTAESGSGPAPSSCALLGGGPYSAQAPGFPRTLWPSLGAQRRHPLAEARPWPTGFGFLRETATLPQLPISTLLATLLLASPASCQPAQPQGLLLTSWVLRDAAGILRGLVNKGACTHCSVGQTIAQTFLEIRVPVTLRTGVRARARARTLSRKIPVPSKQGLAAPWLHFGVHGLNRDSWCAGGTQFPGTVSPGPRLCAPTLESLKQANAASAQDLSLHTRPLLPLLQSGRPPSWGRNQPAHV